MNGEVSVESSPLTKNSAIYKIINYSNEAILFFPFIGNDNGFFKFDFKEKKVQLTNYAFHFPKEYFYFNSKSWEVEGSMMGMNVSSTFHDQ